MGGGDEDCQVAGVVREAGQFWKVKHEWSVERHWRDPLKFQDAVKEVLLMWNHDQYEEGECEGIRWNELPLEVVMRIVKWLGLYERVLDDRKREETWREETRRKGRKREREEEEEEEEEQGKKQRTE
eukprot:TRINITY_DN6409_c0_g2_i3.p1 TRINITY_DN6409_c0_g2~~TRINITY_DN6409_c0_g2_i3.p1  ORF type:complete len:127 (+),score=33.23 TRINITY_DN6409_c0_g2_i3:52-432(+)